MTGMRMRMINNEDNLGPGSKDWEPWLKDNLEELLDEAVSIVM